MEIVSTIFIRDKPVPKALEQTEHGLILRLLAETGVSISDDNFWFKREQVWPWNRVNGI